MRIPQNGMWINDKKTLINIFQTFFDRFTVMYSATFAEGGSNLSTLLIEVVVAVLNNIIFYANSFAVEGVYYLKVEVIDVHLK